MGSGSNRGQTLGVGILGASGIAPAYVELFRNVPGVSVEAVYSRSVERATQLGVEKALPVHTSDLKKVLDSARVNMVAIVCEPARHADLANKAMDAGKHILREKPLDADLVLAARLRERAKCYKGVVSVVSQRRFEPALMDMKSCLDRWADARPIVCRLSMMWHRGREYYTKSGGWRKRDGGVMVNHAIHWLDVMNWFFGKPSEVAVVNGRSREFLECADYASGLVRYAGGQLVVFSCGTYCNLSHPDHLTIDSPVGRCDYRGTGTRMAGRSLARKAARWLGLKRFDQPNPMQRQVQDFVDSVREGREPPTTVDQAYEALKLASALSMDSRTGGIRLTGGFKTPVIP